MSDLTRTLAYQRQDRLVKLINLNAPLEIVAENAALVIYSRVGGRHWAAAWWMIRRAMFLSWAGFMGWIDGVRYRTTGHDPYGLLRETEDDDDDGGLE